MDGGSDGLLKGVDGGSDGLLKGVDGGRTDCWKGWTGVFLSVQPNVYQSSFDFVTKVQILKSIKKPKISQYQFSGLD